MTHAIRSRRLLHACAIIALSAGLCGCTAQDLAQLQQAHDQTTATLAAARSADAQIQQQLTTLPASDPVRKQLQPLLDRLDQVIAQAQKYLPLADAAIKSAQARQIDPAVAQAVSVIPYGSLALAVATLIFGLFKHVQAGTLAGQQQQIQKAFEQVVSAMDAAIPTPTPEQKAKVEGVLDTDVKARVAQVRGS